MKQIHFIYITLCIFQCIYLIQSGGVAFTVSNQCSYNVWVGMQGRSPSNPGWTLPNGGGWLLTPGQSSDIETPNDLSGARFWGRTGCTDSPSFHCETGDCGPWVECAWDGVQRGGQPPATLAEFTLGGWQGLDFYDVSLVDGFNVPMTVEVKNPNSPSGTHCTNPGCIEDLNTICPSVLQVVDSSGQVVACDSACEKFNTDQYCCRGAYGTPQTCIPTQWPVDYAAIFKQACPTAYSYAYDDASSTFTCTNTGYNVIFCQGGTFLA